VVTVSLILNMLDFNSHNDKLSNKIAILKLHISLFQRSILQSVSPI
jgi:hypothetical protein